MFFFFVGGLEQQVRQVLKSDAARCIACGSMADLVEYEKVLRAFFVPVWRWPGKDQLLHCNNCNLFFPPQLSADSSPRRTMEVSEQLDVLRCRFCERAVEPEFSFCPFCGSSLN